MRKSRGPSGAVPDEIVTWLDAAARPQYLAEDGSLIGRPFVSRVFDGVRWVAVGHRITKIAPDATVHDFLEGFLGRVLSPEWIAREQARPLEQRHPIARWHADLAALRARPPAASHDGVNEVDPTGSALAFLTLAWDAYCIEHTSFLDGRVVQRLRHREEFQGARYELAVAGLFARAGFVVEWIHDTTRKRPEFTATHAVTGDSLVVEAKSRRRAGVLGHPGRRAAVVRADLDHLLTGALTKETDGVPYVIYLDANLPPSAQPQGWFDDIRAMLDARPEGTAATPDPFTGITVTNFAWHYLGDAPAAGGGESLLVVPLFSAAPLRDARTLEMLFEAAQQYGSVPHAFPDD